MAVQQATATVTATIPRVWVELPCSRLASAVLEATATDTATATATDKAAVTATASKAAAIVNTIKQVAKQVPS